MRLTTALLLRFTSSPLTARPAVLKLQFPTSVPDGTIAGMAVRST